MRLPKWSIAALLILGPSTALAIGAVVCDPTLSPVYGSPTTPGAFLYPDGGGGCTYYIPLPDGGRIPVPPGDAGAAPATAIHGDTYKNPSSPGGWGDGTSPSGGAPVPKPGDGGASSTAPQPTA